MKMKETSRGIDKKLYVNNDLGKGVITQILPDREMPMRIADGKNLDIIISPNSVIGRINLGQIHETTINRISEEVYKEMVSKKTDEEAIAVYLEFMKDLLPSRLHDQLKQIEKLKGKKLKTYIDSIKEEGLIYIPQVPFENISRENMSKWYNRYKLNNDYISINGNKVMNPVLTGMQYFLKIKHEPSKKISFTNIRKIGTKTLQPAKAGPEHKAFKSPISSSPNTIGEQESSILMALSKDMYIMKELALLKSSDVKNRDKFLELMYTEDEIKMTDFDTLESIAVTNLDYYLNVIGLKL